MDIECCGRIFRQQVAIADSVNDPRAELALILSPIDYP